MTAVKKSSAYVRFVVGKRSADPRWLTGIVVTARLKRRCCNENERKSISRVFKWLNDNIPCPPFSRMRKNGKWTADAVAWFRASARGPIAKLRPIIQILRKHGYVVRTIRANSPGRIVYRDRWQVVAETPKSLA